MTTQIQPLLTIADLDCTPDDGNKYELIEGEIYMSRAPSLTHQIVLRNFLMAMSLYLTDNPIGVVVPGPGVIFDDFNGVIPLVDLESRTVEVYQLRGEGLELAASFSGDDEMTSSVLSGFRSKLPELFRI